MLLLLSVTGFGVQGIQDAWLFALVWTLLLLHFYVDDRPLSGLKIALVVAAALSGLAKFSMVVPAGIVLGARVPIVLTSRADSRESRIASCAIALMLAPLAAILMARLVVSALPGGLLEWQPLAMLLLLVSGGLAAFRNRWAAFAVVAGTRPSGGSITIDV